MRHKRIGLYQSGYWSRPLMMVYTTGLDQMDTGNGEWYNRASAKTGGVQEDKMTTKSPANDTVAVPENRDNAPIEPPMFDPNQAWDVAVRDADQVLGHDLAKDEVLDALVGVPFLITRMTFHPGEAGQREAYVSCELQLAPRPELERRRVNLATLPFDPGDLV